MQPRISIITIGVDDLERAFAFYRVLFDLPDERIGAGEDHVAFWLDGDLSFVLFAREQLAQTARQEWPVAHQSAIQHVLSHTAGTAAEVDAILLEAVRAGGEIHAGGEQSEWGYSGYFKDTEGNLWEVLAAGETVN